MKLQKKMIIGISLVVLMTMHTTILSASDFKNVGHSGANFLQIAAEPRGAALAGSFVALARGAEGVYWNPASIVLNQRPEILFASAAWILDTRLLHAAAVTPLFRNMAIGAGITSFDAGNLEVTTPQYPDGTGENFKAGNAAYTLSYAQRLSDRFCYGLNIKWIDEHIWDMHSSTYAFDFGSVYQADFYNLRIGMIIANFGGNLKMRGRQIDDRIAAERALSEENNPRLERLAETYSLPQYFNVGVAFDPLATPVHRLTITATAIDPNDNRTRASYGFEYAFKNLLLLRGGYDLQHDLCGLNAGLGITYPIGQYTTAFDYGFSDFGPLGAISYVSIRLSF